VYINTAATMAGYAKLANQRIKKLFGASATATRHRYVMTDDSAE